MSVHTEEAVMSVPEADSQPPPSLLSSMGDIPFENGGDGAPADDKDAGDLSLEGGDDAAAATAGGEAPPLSMSLPDGAGDCLAARAVPASRRPGCMASLFLLFFLSNSCAPLMADVICVADPRDACDGLETSDPGGLRGGEEPYDAADAPPPPPPGAPGPDLRPLPFRSLRPGGRVGTPPASLSPPIRRDPDSE